MLKGMRNALPTPLTGMNGVLIDYYRDDDDGHGGGAPVMMMHLILMMMMMMQAPCSTNVHPAAQEFSLNDGIHSCAMCISSSLLIAR